MREDLLNRLVQPFYLQMMRLNALEHGQTLLPQIIEASAGVPAADVIALLRDPWRSTVMGAWISLTQKDNLVADAVLEALVLSEGSLTAPPLATAAVVLAPATAPKALQAYLRRDVQYGWGADGFVAAALEFLGATSNLAEPTPTDRQHFMAMLLLGHRLRDRFLTSPSAPRPLTRLTPRELLELHSAILSELVDRNMIRSRNAPAGDYAELLVAMCYGGVLAAPSVKSFDVTIGDETVQVKSCVVANGRSATFSPFRTFDFDRCVFVVFNSADYEVEFACEIDREAVESMSRPAPWVAGRRISVAQVRASHEARNITAGLRATQHRIEVEHAM